MEKENKEFVEQDYMTLIDGQQQLESESHLKWQLEPKSVIEEIELQLRGLQYVKGRGIIEFRPAFISEEGIGMIILMLRSHLNHNNVLGVISEDMSFRITKSVSKVLNKLIFMNLEKWNITHENWGLINIIVQHQILMFFTRPIAGKERDSIRQIYAFNESGKGLQNLAQRANAMNVLSNYTQQNNSNEGE